MFALNVMSIWICSRELFRPRAIAQWIETAASLESARKVFAIACNNLPLVFRSSVEI